MPKIKIDHVVSFSSEDPIHIANNILNPDPAKKWKCASPGEKTATIVLQLEKASTISSLDIGNEHSAYIEVLVSRSGASDEYKVLLVMSSFMTPLEARQSTNINKVRMFGQDQLSKPECEQKWDRIKIVCTQPFNRHVQYGLSFISISTSEAKAPSTPLQTTIGKFTLRPDSPDSLSLGSLFARRKEIGNDEPLKGAAAIRVASSLAQSGTPICKPKIKPRSSTPTNGSSKRLSLDEERKKPPARNRNELLYSKDEEEPNEKIDKLMEKKEKESKEKKTKEEDSDNDKHKKNKKDKRQSLDISVNSSNNDKENKKDEPGSSKTSRSSETGNGKNKRKYDNENESGTPKKPKKQMVTKPFGQLLKGVTLVISGILNPDRATLRRQASELGAKYKPDWGTNCTHLICAFANTPKFNQVKGKGKIVTKKWIEDCHSQRKRLPWRRYALDRNDIGKDESEEEIWEEAQAPEEIVSIPSPEISEQLDEGSDTEQEVARILSQQKKEKENQDPYMLDTDDEVLSSPKNIDHIPKRLKEFFKGRVFFIDQIFDETEFNRIQKYLVAYKGTVTENPIEANECITTSGNKDLMKEINPNVICVKPDWVWECHNNQKLVPVDDYLLY